MLRVSSLLQDPKMDRLIRLDEGSATATFIDSHNFRTLFRWLPLLTVLTAGRLLWMLAVKPSLSALWPILGLVSIRALYAWREQRFFEVHFRHLLVLFVVIQWLVWRALVGPQAFHPLDIAFPCLLLVLRLPTASLVAPLLVAWSMASGHSLVHQWMTEADPRQSLWALAQSLCIAVVIGLNDAWTRSMQEQFLEDWRRDRRRSVEHHRMREELGDARRIQLSMLPKQAPQFAGLDMAGISIPASEVGGDYYDYFPLDARRLVVVVADVAGHGVASGLVLSGLRSCLHLLLDAPPSPTTVLQKLDRVVRQTAGRRHFVTMIYALFDLEQRRLTVAAAGHPPLLHLQHGPGSVVEIGHAALPLGTPLRGTFQQHTTHFDDDDVFLLYSDGVAETCNDRTEAYGNERLRDTFGAFAGRRRNGEALSARRVRDSLLSDIVQFKGDREQTDDITVLAVRVRPTAARQGTSPSSLDEG